MHVLESGVLHLKLISLFETESARNLAKTRIILSTSNSSYKEANFNGMELTF